MQSRIGHIHVRYRVPRGSRAGAGAVPSLDRIVRDHIAAACDRAFASAFGDDAAMYVVRGVQTRIALSSEAACVDARTADRWGHSLCGAVVRTIAAQDRDRVVKFEDSAAFAASFLTDFVAGLAWNRWFYERYAPLRSLNDGDVILAVLDDHREDVRTVLARLRRSGTLDEVLRRLGPDGQRQLWGDLARTHERGDDSAEALRIFVQAAMTAAGALGLWTSAPPDLSRAVDEYARTRPAAPDWTSAVSLADAVADMIRWLAIRGSIDPSRAPADALDHLRSAADGLDWFDRSRLAERIVGLGSAAAARSPQTARVLRPFDPTPAQRRLLDLLRRVVSDGTAGVVPADAAEANMLRLVAALVERGDPVRGHTLAIIEHCVNAWKAIALLGDRRTILRALRRGDLSAALSGVMSRHDDVKEHFAALIHAGTPALDIAEALAASSAAPEDADLAWMPTRAAGLFLLVRAVQDLRLPALARAHGLPTVRPLLAALAVAYGGAVALADDALDPGAALWVGIDPAEFRQTLEPLEQLDAPKFIVDVRALLEAQGAIAGDEDIGVTADASLVPLSTGTVDFVGRLGALVLRGWGRWLPGLGRSSTAYLLAQFIRRRGAVAPGNGAIDVRLEPAPLDQVLRMAGYLSEPPPVQWLGARVVRFHGERRP